MHQNGTWPVLKNFKQLRLRNPFRHMTILSSFFTFPSHVTETGPVPVSVRGGHHLPAGRQVTVTDSHKSRHQFCKTALSLIAVCFILISFVLAFNSTAHASSRVKTNEPDLCFKCHEELKKNLSNEYTHFMFKQGKCGKCHNPHVSNIKGLMSDEINSLCLNCHKSLGNLLKKGNVHSVIKKGLCTDCHYAHSGKNKHLLVKPRNKLCWDCHENLREELKKDYVHPLFKEGACSSCHNSHVSKEENLLKSMPNKTCTKCHAPRCKAGKTSIAYITEPSDCTTCHTGHSSKNKGLLGPKGHISFLNQECEQCHNPILPDEDITTTIEGKKLCFSCHKRATFTQYIDDDLHVKDHKNPCILCHDHHASEKNNLTINETVLCLTCHESIEKKTTFMMKALKTKCAPVVDRKCFDCHMLKCSNERPLYFTGDTVFLCNRCHEAEHRISHPLGKGVIDPRNGQQITCLSCHSVHSARSDFMLTFDKKRTLCIQCHKKSY